MNGPSTLENKQERPVAEEPGRGASTGDDSDATIRSSSEDVSQPSARYGLRPKRSRPARGSSEEGPEASRDTQNQAAVQDTKAEEGVTGPGKRRKRAGKGSEGAQPDGLLRLAQIAHAAPRLPGQQTEKEGKEGGGQATGVSDTPVKAEPLLEAPVGGDPNGSTAFQTGPIHEGLQAVVAPQDQAMQPADVSGAGHQAVYQEDLRFTPLQIRALAAAGQLNLPGFTAVPCPYVQLGARWQLDLRTGERLEDQGGQHLGSSALHSIAGMQGTPNSGFPLALGGQVLGSRPPIFTAPGPQGLHAPPAGGYGVVPPPNNTNGALQIPALGQQSLPQGLSPAGPYTALLGHQMQPLLPAGILPSGQYPQGFHGLGNTPHMHHMPAALPRKRQPRASHAAEFADLPEIPLRRRGRPAGDGSAAMASPQELQERRMQANRAAASRSHFRRKREMEVLEKECSTLEARVLELRSSLTGLVTQEETLRLQQVGIREHLALGCKPSSAAPSAPQEAPSEPALPAEATPTQQEEG